MVASYDSAEVVDEENQYKYCDDLQILDLVLLGNLLEEYDFSQHVASDIGIGQKFLPPQNCKTLENLNSIAQWTDENLMEINESKSNYLIFSRSQKQFATRFTINNQHLEHLNITKILGVWLSEDGSWSKNTHEII